MDKIKVNNPVVEIEGDEMTRIIWEFIRDDLILPYLEIELETYDLSIQSRDKTKDRITIDAAEAINRKEGGAKLALPAHGQGFRGGQCSRLPIIRRR